MFQGSPVRGYHHITMCVGSAQEDYDFHVKVLGLRMIKKTVLFDGREPFYHLYYGNASGQEGSLVTTFPMDWKTSGGVGSGQVCILSLSVPEGSFSFWEQRLQNFGYNTRVENRLGARRLCFNHPCGIAYEIIEMAGDTRSGWAQGGVPVEAAIQGMRSVTISTRDLSPFSDFLSEGLGFVNQGKDGRNAQFAMGGGVGSPLLEVLHEEDRPQGSWTWSRGTVHHIAFDLPTAPVQLDLKLHLEGLGYTDVSEVKDRNYFNSVYVRTPSGALFEAAVTQEQGWLKDEPAATLGQELKFPPQLIDRRDEMIGKLEPIVH
ncbi:VOC family protein [Ensifer adhaerens]|uniref:VOC family protein n=1 Tax=Ensifer adhaerens TaxID=106592 RepID=UPI001CBF6228|nr:VOC family protein [Ensifer adhaerens]MBZ7924805.1 VOC family protein [Ensifer adhaerens]UAX95973.1 VOC family protein [Ensifer adhaerens]UAY04685.1 VOC family protein [Ensifer adhaerens]UAY10116.1 VOC family protein [Ensifer adhaerens]